jgi:hypothetical protein
MLYFVAVLGLLDHLSKAKAIPYAGEYAAGILALVPLAMMVIVVPAARRLDSCGPGFVSWRLVGLGMTSIAVGNVIFVTLYLTTGKDPYPGVADVFSLGMYAFISTALCSAVMAHRGSWEARRSVLAAAIVTGVVALLGYHFVVGPYLLSSAASWQPWGLRAFNTLYLGLDAVLLVAPSLAVALLGHRLRIGHGVLPVWVLLGSAIIVAVADMLFAYTCCVGVGRTALVDVGYALSPLLVGFAVLVADDVSRVTGGPASEASDVLREPASGVSGVCREAASDSEAPSARAM